MPDELVEVAPATVLRVAEEFRQASRRYSAAGWRMSTSLPLMPPRFLARAQLTLDVIAGRLQNLALQMELDASVEVLRMGRLREAGADVLVSDVRALLIDLNDEGHQAWADLSAESGPEAGIDPLGGQVHIALGITDTVSQMFQVAESLSHLDPAYAARDPAGAARARQERIAMAINLVYLLPDTALIDPAGHRQASEQAEARLADWGDLHQGDLPRWVGHLGSGIALTWLVRAIPPADNPALRGGAALDGAGDGPGGLIRGGYEGLSHANRLPTESDDPRSKQAPSRPKEIQARIASFVEQPRGR